MSTYIASGIFCQFYYKIRIKKEKSKVVGKLGTSECCLSNSC